MYEAYLRASGLRLPIVMVVVTREMDAPASHPEDFVRKLTRAMEVTDGMVYIHLLTPCPVGWRSATEMSIQLCKMAVETNYFPLWEADKGRFSITHRVTHPRPISEFTRLMGRFSHLTEADIKQFQKTVDRRLEFIEGLARMTTQTCP